MRLCVHVIPRRIVSFSTFVRLLPCVLACVTDTLVDGIGMISASSVRVRAAR